MDKKFFLGLALFLGGISLMGHLLIAREDDTIGFYLGLFSVALIIVGLILSIKRTYQGEFREMAKKAREEGERESGK